MARCSFLYFPYLFGFSIRAYDQSLKEITNLMRSFSGTMSSLKNVKKDVMEMRRDTDCGISFEQWTDFRVGDQVQSYENDVKQRSL